jgi:hypothetical protein
MANCTCPPYSFSLPQELNGPVASILCALVLAMWQYLLKLPSVQRALGAENTDKKEKLAEIHASVTAAPEPTEVTPLKS